MNSVSLDFLTKDAAAREQKALLFVSGKNLVSLEKEKKKKVKHTPQYKKVKPFFVFTFRHE